MIQLRVHQTRSAVCVRVGRALKSSSSRVPSTPLTCCDNINFRTGWTLSRAPWNHKTPEIWLTNARFVQSNAVRLEAQRPACAVAHLPPPRRSFPLCLRSTLPSSSFLLYQTETTAANQVELSRRCKSLRQVAPPACWSWTVGGVKNCYTQGIPTFECFFSIRLFKSTETNPKSQSSVRLNFKVIRLTMQLSGSSPPLATPVRASEADWACGAQVRAEPEAGLADVWEQGGAGPSAESRACAHPESIRLFRRTVTEKVT